MLISIIKFYVIYYFTNYICFKLMKTTVSCFKTKVCFYILPLLLALMTHYLDSAFVEIKYIGPLISLSIILGIFTTKPKLSFVASILSFGISYSTHAISSFIFITITYVIFKNFETLPYSILAILSTLLQTILIKCLLSLPRFKGGLTRVLSTNYINFASVICLAFMSFSVYVYTNKSYGLGILSFIFLYAFLIFWWQAQITKAYHHQLELRASESLRTENTRLLLENRMLTEDKDRMAYITHRDNTLITTLKNATLSYLSTDYSDPEEALKARDELIANIEALSAGRASLPDNYNEKQARTFDTNFTLLNKLLHQMDADAIQQNIMFSVHFGVMLDEFVPRDISEMDLVHTVDDLLKNAFKATRNSEPRMVQLQFYRLGKHFVVEVADNGIPFEVRSLVNMGMEKLTTYEDGSGIGLVDIWSTKEKCGATYHLEEYVTPSPFSKKISLTFDKKNRYSIRTWRKDEILQMSRRADLQVYEHME